MKTVLTFEEFTGHLREQLLEEYPGELRPETNLFDEIGLDSFEMFHVVMLVEDITGLEVSLEEPPPMTTLQDTYAFYRAVIATAGQPVGAFPQMSSPRISGLSPGAEGGRR
jgi:acyl carrier protein